MGKEAPLGRLTRCYRGVCRARLVLCYWSVKRSNECIAQGPTRRGLPPDSIQFGQVKQFLYPARVCYLSRVGRPCLAASGEESSLGYNPPPLALREISCLRGNGQVMRYRRTHTYV